MCLRDMPTSGTFCRKTLPQKAEKGSPEFGLPFLSLREREGLRVNGLWWKSGLERARL
jgi:hypothetical protein